MKLYRIKKSDIDKKGKGLYATRDIKEGGTGAFESLSALSQNSDVIQGELDNNATIIAQLGRFTNNELVKTMESSFLDFRKLAVGAMNKTGRDIFYRFGQGKNKIVSFDRNITFNSVKVKNRVNFTPLFV